MTTRRAFLAGVAGAGFVASSGLRAAAPLPPKSPMGIASTAMGMHLRGIAGVPGLRGDPVAYLDYCRSLGAGGVQHAVSTDLKRFRARLDEFDMFYEGELAFPRSLDEDTAGFEKSVADAAALGATCARAVSRAPLNSTGRRYESFTSYADYRAWQTQADAIVLKCLPIAERYRVAIALENHKDRTVDEHVAFLAKTSSPYLGALVDPGNPMALMEDPVDVVTRLAPYAKACSLKDMGVAPDPAGFLLSEVLFDTGMSDQKALFAILRKVNPKINAVSELITRDPLKVPVRNADYYRSFAPGYERRRDSWLAMVAKRATVLPVTSTLTPAEQYALEEANNRKVFAWGLAKLA